MIALLLFVGCNTVPTEPECQTTGHRVGSVTLDTLPDGTIRELVLDGYEAMECDLSEPWCICLDEFEL